MAEEVQTGADLGESMGNAGAAVKDGIVGGLRGIHEIEAEIVSLVRHTLADTVKATGTVASESVTVLSGVMQGTMQATAEAGTGLVVSTKQVATGVLEATSELSDTAVRAATDILVGAVEGVKAVLGALLPRASSAPPSSEDQPAPGASTQPGRLPAPSQTRRTAKE